ncbi:MAG: hypothetical protein ACI4LN_06350, partial [Anaerovoracaceae bacterium]
MKKFFAVLMCLIMVVVFMPTMAWAEGEENFSDEPMQLYAFKVGEGTTVTKEDESGRYIVSGTPLTYIEKLTNDNEDYYFAKQDGEKYILLAINFPDEGCYSSITEKEVNGITYYTIGNDGEEVYSSASYQGSDDCYYSFSFFFNLENPEKGILIINSQCEGLTEMNVNVSDKDSSSYSFFVTYAGTSQTSSKPNVFISKYDQGPDNHGWSEYA